MKRSLVIWAFLAVILAALPSAHAQSAAHWFKQGQAAETKDDTQAAYEAYYKAYQKKPGDERYKLAWERTRFSAASLHVEHGERLRDQGDDTAALTEFLRALEIDPSNELASQDIKATRDKINSQSPAPESAPKTTDEALELAAPIQLRPISNEPLTLHMVEDSRIVYQAVGKAAGINVLFDPAYTSKRIQVDLNMITLQDALRIVATVSNTFWRPITSNTIFVAENTRSKHTELDEQAVETFYLHNVAQQNDFTEVQTVLRNLFQGARINGVASESAIVMRGTPDELLLARRLIDDLDKARPEVVVDVAVLEVSRDLLRNIGVQLPQTASISFQPSNANLSNTTSSTNNTSTTTPAASTTTSSITLNNLAHLNSTNFAVTIGQAAVDLLLTDTRSRIIQNPQIRASDGQQATLKIGERIPIATGSYQTGAATAIVSSLVNTQFQYIDVGVNIEMTPTVHYNRDVTLKIAIEVSSESNNVTIEGVTEPIIAQKKSEQTIRLREGEAAILGGILNQQDIQSWTGIPGLSSIPILKYLFGSKDHQITDDEIVFLLIPHVVRSPELTASNLRPIDTGAGQQIELRHMSTEGDLSPIAPPIRPAAAQPGIGIVPGQSAQAAAPDALAQMRTSAQAGPPVSTPNSAALPGTGSGPGSSPGAPPPGLRFSLVPSSGPSVAAGSTFQVPIVVTGARDIASVPLQVQYDPAKLSLMNVGDGDFLGRDGQAVALVHRDDGPGTLTINASRPPGAVGVSGAGVVCVLTFQAKVAGNTPISITRPGAMTSAQQPVPAERAQTTIVVK